MDARRGRSGMTKRCAPYQTIYEKFGVNAAAIAAEARRLLKK